MRWVIVLLLLAACASQPAVICNEPYILVGEECCLDKDENGACDSDERAAAPVECPEFDCSQCPAEVVEREVVKSVTKYVCAKSGEEVDDPEECKPKGPVAADFSPILTNEEGTAIETFELRPACRDGFNAGEIHVELGSTSPEVLIQVKDNPTSSWEDVFAYTGGALEKYFYIAFCDGQCTGNAEFYLSPDSVYLLRARIDYRSLYEKYQYSNEYIIDTTEESSFMTKLC